MGCESLAIDAITAIAVVLGAAAAWSGVNTWQRELKGKAEFDAARNLMRAVYRAREAIRTVRARMVMAYEFPSGYEPPVGKSRESSAAEASAWAYVLNNRWQQLLPAVEEVQLHSLEAEVLLGKEVKEKTEAFLHCIHRLRGAIDMYLFEVGNPAADPQREYAVKRNEVLFGALGDDENAFSNEILRAISGLESVLKTHMKES